MSGPIITGALPQAGPPPGTFRVVWPRIGLPLNLTLLSDGITGVITHWKDEVEAPPKGRTVPCDPLSCPLCVQRRERVWKGYFPAWDHDRRKVCVGCCTRESVGLLIRTVGRQTPLRGRRLSWCRAGKDDHQSTFWALSTDSPLSPLPDEPDVVPTLCYVLGAGLPAILARWREEQEGLE